MVSVEVDKRKGGEGMALSFAKAEEQAKVTYLSAITEQNWMIIRQLSRLNKNIEGLKESR